MGTKRLGDMLLSPQSINEEMELKGVCLVQWKLMSKALPESLSMLYFNVILVSDIVLLISGQPILIIFSSFPTCACFPLDLWPYGMSYDNYFNVCLQVLHLFLVWLIVLLIKGLIFLFAWMLINFWLYARHWEFSLVGFWIGAPIAHVGLKLLILRHCWPRGGITGMCQQAWLAWCWASCMLDSWPYVY